MERRQIFAVIALIGLAAAAALWFAIGGRGSKSAPPPAPTGIVGSPAPEAPPASPTAPLPPSPPTLAPAPKAVAEEHDAGPAALRSTGVIVATVKAKDGTPIAGARIIVNEDVQAAIVRTDASGVARVADVDIGRTYVRAEAEGWAPEEGRANVEADGEENLTFEMTAGLRFDGSVVDEATGRGVGGATVSVTENAFGDAAWSMCSATRTDEGGRFHVPGFPLGGHHGSVEVVAEGYATTNARFGVKEGKLDPSPLVVRLPLGGRVAGTVKDPDGKPVAEATVYVFPASSEEFRAHPDWGFSSTGGQSSADSATTDAEGRYAVKGLRLDEEYGAAAKKKGFALSDRTLGLRLTAAAREAKVDLALRAFGTIRVRLLGPDGKGIGEAAEVSLSDSFAERPFHDFEKDAYEFDGLEPGDHWVVVQTPSFLQAQTKALVEAGAVRDVVISLAKGVAIEGVVVDEAGRPVEGIAVAVGGVDDNERRDYGLTMIGGRFGSSDADGRFIVAGLEPGDYVVAAGSTWRANPQSVLTLKRSRVTAPTKEVRLVVVRLGTASIRIVTPDGKPYAGHVSVTSGPVLMYSRGGGQETKDGRFRFEGIEPGEFQFGLEVEGFAPIERKFVPAMGKETEFGDVVLDRGVDLHGHVTDLAGAPIPGAMAGGAEADATGAFTLEHLPRGPFHLGAWADGFLEYDRQIDVEPGLAPVVVVLERGTLVRVVARYADGKPAEDEMLVAVRLGADGKPDTKLGKEWDHAGKGGRVQWRVAPGRWKLFWGPIANLKLAGEPPLAEWTLSEGETRDVEVTLPAK